MGIRVRRFREALFSVLALPMLAGTALAGPYAPAAGDPGSTAIHMDDAAFVGWATGYQSYVAGSEVDAGFQTPAKALGKAVGDAFDIVSLGRGGRITTTFGTVIGNGDGPDFAVFENSFSDTFLELAWVEVSTDGNTFVRFPNDSQTPGPVGGFGTVDPTDVDGFAGKYRQGYGTPFDLDDVAGEAEVQDGRVNLTQIRYVRLVDVVGDGSAVDTSGDVIYDPFPTIGSAGFDLDAVGVIHEGFENTSPPDQPELASPTDASTVPLPVTLETGPFSDPDEAKGDSHGQTAWEISGNIGFSDIVTGVTSTKALTELKMFGALLEGGKTYWWRVRFFDSGSKPSDWADAWSLTTQAPVDTNDNGIPDASDLAPGTVETVAGDKVLQGADGTSQVGLTVAVATGGVNMAYAETLDPADLPLLGGSEPDMMSVGVISFRLEGVPAGGTVQVSVTLSEAAPPGYGYVKYDPAEGWKPFSGAVFSGDRREVTLTLQDGGAGDADGLENGVIVDPGGVGFVSVAAATGGGGTGGGTGGSGSATRPDGNGEAGFGGSGCFLNSLTGGR